jgi:DNA primase large subunit
LFFTDYLRNATRFQAKGWKLVNRVVLNGEVYLTKDDTARLLEEEVRVHIEKKLDIKEKIALPQNVAGRVERLKQAFTKQKGKIELEGFPKEFVVSAFPPCIKHMYDGITSGHHLSHIGRFALTSFLTNIGMTAEEVINLYRSLSDFKERLTRYQVEHIAGGRGSRTKYIPPRCDTLRTHGVCTGMDEICRRIRHPLAYYRRKLRTIKAEAPVE